MTRNFNQKYQLTHDLTPHFPSILDLVADKNLTINTAIKCKLATKPVKYSDVSRNLVFDSLFWLAQKLQDHLVHV